MDLVKQLLRVGSPSQVEAVCSLLLKQSKYLLEKDADLAFAEIFPLLVEHTAAFVQARVGRYHQKSCTVLHACSDLLYRCSPKKRADLLKKHTSWLLLLLADLADAEASEVFAWVESSAQLVYKALSCLKAAGLAELLEEVLVKTDLTALEIKMEEMDVGTTRARFEDIVAILKTKRGLGDYDFNECLVFDD